VIVSSYAVSEFVIQAIQSTGVTGDGGAAATQQQTD
jgi:hypothetical protein